MKHTSKVTFVLLSIFLASQLFGLFALNLDLEVEKDEVTGEVISYEYSDTAIGQRPQGTPFFMVFFIMFAILFGTGLMLLLIKFKQTKIWKLWFFLAVFLTITVTLDVFTPKIVAYIAAFILAVFKLYRPNFYVQNASEVLMYSGIAILFVPILNVTAAIILLLLISIYDAYAVWKSKHMIKLANFQTESQVFAGLSIPYTKIDEKKSKIQMKIPKAQNFKSTNTKTKNSVRVAILGGGDVAFPMIFTGTVMQSLIIGNGLSKPLAFFQAQIVTIGAATALYFLLTKGEKDKFYPAMPFITAGCFLGFAIVYLINLV